jgi:hypothetical protein
LTFVQSEGGMDHVKEVIEDLCVVFRALLREIDCEDIN